MDPSNSIREGGEEEEDQMEHDYAAAEEYADPSSANPEEIEEMKKRLKEMEEEAGALREMQAKVEKEMGAASASAGEFQSSDENTANGDAAAGASQVEKEEVDARSIYVGNVDYACSPEEVQQHFQSCGTVNRVTILTDRMGQPKGFAYVEFVEVEAVQNALLLNESELHGRQLKVSAKRTNVPGMKLHRGGRRGFRPGPYMPPPFYSPYGYGKAPRYRRPMRYRPYY